MGMNLKNSPKDFKINNILKGNQGEQIVSYLLRKQGYFVTCLSDINEQNKKGAPGMRNNNQYLILPDLQIAMKGTLGYCEVKWKTNATYTRKTKRLEHGVDKTNWDHYIEVAKETGAIVYLFIYERKTGAVLYNHTEFLAKCLRYSSKMGKGGMCFFPRASFFLWGKVIPVGKDLYEQLSMFDIMEAKGKGNKLFNVINHVEKLEI